MDPQRLSSSFEFPTTPSFPFPSPSSPSDHSHSVPSTPTRPIFQNIPDSPANFNPAFLASFDSPINFDPKLFDEPLFPTSQFISSSTPTSSPLAFLSPPTTISNILPPPRQITPPLVASSSDAKAEQTEIRVTPPRQNQKGSKFTVDDMIRKGFLRLNEQTEIYLWSSKEALVFKLKEIQDTVAKGYDASSFDTVLEFPPHSYYQFVEYQGENKPPYIYTPDTTSSTFIRCQRCVEGCDFKTEGKKPSIIRHHLATCKLRMKKLDPASDPLAKLCALQHGQKGKGSYPKRVWSFWEKVRNKLSCLPSETCADLERERSLP